jgi:hypothetical protein
MLKPIPKSDISIRPFKVYKDWSFTNASTEIDLLTAQYTASYAGSGTTSDTNLSFNNLSLYGQLRAQFYNGNEDNPFLRIGRKTSNYAINNLEKERLLSDSAKDISIPQTYIGEGIKPGSFTLIDNNRAFTDDSYGNIVGDSGFNGVLVSLIDNQTNEFNFSDQLNNEYSASLNYININDNEISFDLDATTYVETLISFDTETGIMVLENATFLPTGLPSTKIGNIFYDKGLVVITLSPSTRFVGLWEIQYKSTVTIYENEYLLVVGEDEFNVSTNPSATIETGSVVEDFVDSSGITRRVTPYPGVRYVRKNITLDNGSTLQFGYQSKVNSSVYGGFGDGYYSQSIDMTGSYLTPFITAIGLYDDNNDLVAVAKLPKPVKSEIDIPLNFIVRFDT